RITQYMIEHHGFNIVAVEADWPDAESIDRYVRQRDAVRNSMKPNLDKEEQAVAAFSRFPTWMWRNEETRDFVRWLRAYNARLGKEQRAAFYGLDLYSMGASIHAVINYLDSLDPEMGKLARMRYGCLLPFIE